MLRLRSSVKGFPVNGVWNAAISGYSTVAEKCPHAAEGTRKSAETVKKPSVHVDTPEEYAKAKPISQMPGPSAFHLMSNMIRPSGKYYKMGLKELHTTFQREYGDVVKFPGLFGRAPFVFLYDADLVEKVFRNEGHYPDRRSFEFIQEFRVKFRPDLFEGNGGLLQEQGKSWQETRTKVNPVMMQPKTVTRYIPTVDAIASDFVQRIRAIRDDKNEVPADFGNELNKWSLESIAYIALDQRLGLLSETNADPGGQKLIQSVHDFFDLSYDLEVKPSLWKYYKTPTYHKMMKCLNTMTDIVISYIDKSIAEIEKRQASNETAKDEESVLEKLLKIDKRVAIVMASDMLMAGVDTTSNSMSSVLYLLAKNPDKQQILREEIMEKLPTKDTPLTADKMKNMPYLRACIKEAQRLEPVIVGNLRRLADNVVLGGYQVPSDHYVVMAQYIMSNNDKNFGKSQQFIPERFLKTESNTEIKSKQPFAFLPFGFGPRMCIGKRLAELEIETLLSRTIRNFEVGWEYGPPEFGRNTFLNALTGDLKFKFTDIKN